MASATSGFSGAGPAVKVCGITRQQDLDVCCELGAAFTGFIFVRKSPRYVTPEQAAALESSRCEANRPLRVGVFGGHSVDEIRTIADTARLDLIQLHGGEDAAFCHALGPERVIKVLWPQKLLAEAATAVSDLPGLLDKACAPFKDACAFFLLDAGSGGGGSGQTLSWQNLAGFRPSQPWLLAGGIGEDNAAQALAACRPYGIDCNSALESAPGIKEAAKLRALFENIRNQSPYQE